MSGEQRSEEEEPYPLEVDPSRMITVFRAFVLFDELFLHMQATNVAIVDQYVLDLEQDLLHEVYRDRTNTDPQCYFRVRSFPNVDFLCVRTPAYVAPASS